MDFAALDYRPLLAALPKPLAALATLLVLAAAFKLARRKKRPRAGISVDFDRYKTTENAKRNIGKGL